MGADHMAASIPWVAVDLPAAEELAHFLELAAHPRLAHQTDPEAPSALGFLERLPQAMPPSFDGVSGCRQPKRPPNPPNSPPPKPPKSGEGCESAMAKYIGSIWRGH